MAIKLAKRHKIAGKIVGWGIMGGGFLSSSTNLAHDLWGLNPNAVALFLVTIIATIIFVSVAPDILGGCKKGHRWTKGKCIRIKKFLTIVKKIEELEQRLEGHIRR